jgi:type IV secretion/conjugal transfer VirB4 family ATPase
MMPDFVLIASLTIGFSVFSVALGLFLLPRVQSFLVPAPRATFLSDMLSLKTILEDNITILGKDDTLTQTLLVKGVNNSLKTASEIEGLLTRKQQWLDTLAERGASYKVITLRTERQHTLDGGSVSPMLAKIHHQWMTQFEKTFYNRHYLIISHHPKKYKGVLGVLNLFGKIKEEANAGVLKELVAITLSSLHEFQVEILENGTENYSPLLSFWAELVNGEPSFISSYRYQLSERLVSNSVHFNKNKGLITYQNGSKKQFSAAISLKYWGEVSSQDILKEIQAIPGKLVIFQSCKGFGSLQAKLKLEYQKGQAQVIPKLFSAKGNESIAAEFDSALQILETKESSLYDYQLTIFLFSEDESSLEPLLNQVKKILRHYGIAPIQETFAIEWLWRTQFPGLDAFVRPTRCMSHNLAYFIPFDKEPNGLEKCDWGEGPIRLLKTSTGTPYALQFHVSEQPEDLGHCLVVGPTGRGKTTLFQHLIGGALRHPNLKAFIFDRLNGTRIFTQAIGGVYVDLSDGIPLNPFVCDESEENRIFLQNFLLTLSQCDDDEGQNDIGRAIDQIFQVPKEERILKYLFQDMAGVQSKFRAGLEKWAMGNAFSRWFNGAIINDQGRRVAYDALDLEASRLIAFEMKDVQENSQIAAAVTTYIMYRIRSLARKFAHPHLIFIDETQPMLQDRVFAKEVTTILQEHRKLRGVSILNFQTSKSIISSGISDAILEQVGTLFLFPSPQADKKDYEIFKLTDSEWEYINGTSKISRTLEFSVLVKKIKGASESAILDIDLRSLGPLFQLYRSGAEPVRLVRELQQQWGMELWVEKYLGL